MKKKKILLFLIIVFSLISVYAENCYDLFGSGLMKTINDDLLKPLKIIAPIALLIFTSIDFAKNVFNNSTDDKSGNMKSALNRFVKRAVATLLVFFAKEIISFILGLVGIGNCMDDIDTGIAKIECTDAIFNKEEHWNI